MEYSIQELAQLSGVTARTLRWYDEIGLLKPCRVAQSGYRYYSTAQVERLEMILHYRSMGVELKRIGDILDAPAFNRADALREHLDMLRAERERVDGLIRSVEEALEKEMRRENMSDKKRFEAFKRQAVEENERKYGKEARAKYGPEEVDAANARMMGLSEAQYGEWEQLDAEIRNALEAAVRACESPGSDAAGQIVQKHKRWLSISMRSYDPARHRGIAQMYVMDERFTAYYDRNVQGCAQFLRDAVMVWVK